MIIRKPYGFLIKHFKIIHFLLLVPTLFLLLNFSDIGKFFTEYVANDYKTFEVTVAGKYITLLTYLGIIFMIIANGIIYLLMSKKKTSKLTYGIGIIYYLVLLILTVLFYSTLNSIDAKTLDATIINFVTDIAKITPIPGYILLVGYAIKGIGFNFKTMSIDSALELHASEEDDEEVEIKINSDNYTIKRRVTHLIRELKYYVLENKFVFCCFGAVFIILIGIALYMNFEVYNKKYSIYQAFVLDNFMISVKESYITNVDYSGNVISSDNYFIALKIAIENKSGDPISIDSSNFRIYTGKEYIYPSYDRSARFIDLGKNYQGNTIAPGTSADYVFVYEVKKEQLKTQYQIKILSALKVEAGELIPSYKIINIKPKNILKEKENGKYKMGKEISLKNSTLGNTSLKIKSIKFSDIYNYDVISCDGVKNCSSGKYSVAAPSGKTLMIIEDEFVWDENTPYYLNSKKDFYADYSTISYKYETILSEISDTTKIVNITPENLKTAKVYQVPGIINSAYKIDFNIQIRNQKYTINLKNNEK